jgi:hypothetical protein
MSARSKIEVGDRGVGGIDGDSVRRGVNRSSAPARPAASLVNDQLATAPPLPRAFTLPTTPPDGRAGMQPHLALNYSSANLSDRIVGHRLDAPRACPTSRAAAKTSRVTASPREMDGGIEPDLRVAEGQKKGDIFNRCSSMSVVQVRRA